MTAYTVTADRTYTTDEITAALHAMMARNGDMVSAMSVTDTDGHTAICRARDMDDCCANFAYGRVIPMADVAHGIGCDGGDFDCCGPYAGR